MVDMNRLLKLLRISLSRWLIEFPLCYLHAKILIFHINPKFINFKDTDNQSVIMILKIFFRRSLKENMIPVSVNLRKSSIKE